MQGRPKHFYSIYDKMQRENLLYDQIYDLVAFRIIVDTVTDCYAALGVVHANWKPVPARFKDYIALPKNNMYQSLHTTVIGPFGERVEVQIRTHEMHRVAEFGIAAHWKYKGGEAVGSTDAQRFAWLRQLLEWQQNVSDPQEFLGSVKEDLFSDEVFVFTPKGDVLNFPEGSSVIDFAYRIHSEVGQHCAGARVNGRLVPLRNRLRNGDTIEIVTTAGQTPSKDWLNNVKTSRAKARIRAWLKQQQRSRSLEVGREILERDLSRHRLDFKRLRKEGRLQEVAVALSVKDEETLIASVGYGKITTHQVLGRLLPPEQLLEQKVDREEGALRKLFRRMSGQETGVRVSGVGDVLVRFGKCCEPLPGERILGLHHARPRCHGARDRLPARAGERSAEAGRSRLGDRRQCAAPGESRGRLRRSARHAGGDHEIDQRRRSEHQPRPGAEHPGQPGAEPLRGDGGNGGPAQPGDPRHRQAARRDPGQPPARLIGAAPAG